MAAKSSHINQFHWLSLLLLLSYLVYNLSMPYFSGTLISIVDEPNSLQPSKLTDRNWLNISSNQFETLVNYDRDNDKISPSLASSWSVSSDLKEYTFRLKKHVMFHDGSLLDGELVKKSFIDLLSSKNRPVLNVLSLSEYVDRISVPSPMLVRFHLKKPSEIFLKIVGHPALAVLSKGKYGSGPYKFENKFRNRYVFGRFIKYHGNLANIPSLSFRVLSGCKKFDPSDMAYDIHSVSQSHCNFNSLKNKLRPSHSLLSVGNKSIYYLFTGNMKIKV